MRSAFLRVLLLLPLASGCSSVVLSEFDPSKNESTWNALRASLYWQTLHAHAYIPGMATNRHGNTQANMRLGAPKRVDYPWKTELTITLNDEPGVRYRYLIEIPSVDADLVLKRAWKLDDQGNVVVDDLPLPTDEQQRAANELLRDCEELKPLRNQGP